MNNREPSMTPRNLHWKGPRDDAGCDFSGFSRPCCRTTDTKLVVSRAAEGSCEGHSSIDRRTRWEVVAGSVVNYARGPETLRNGVREVQKRWNSDAERWICQTELVRSVWPERESQVTFGVRREIVHGKTRHVGIKVWPDIEVLGGDPRPHRCCEVISCQ